MPNASRKIDRRVEEPAPTFAQAPKPASAAPVAPDAERRSADRAACRIRALTVDFADTNGEWIRCVVPTRNISRTGLAVLTNQYIYPRTPCRVHLFCEASAPQVVPASVVRCRYLPGTGRLHEVGLRFEEPLDLALAQRTIAECRILVCADDPTVHQIVPRLVNQFRVRVSSVRCAAEAVRVAAAERIEVVLLDADCPGETGGLAVRDLRASGFSRPIFAITDASDPRTLRRCLEAGFTQIASRPLTRDSLTALLSSTQCEPLISARAHDLSVVPAIAEFVRDLPIRLSRIEIAVVGAVNTAVAPIIRELRSDAAALGFEVICRAAEQVEAVLTAGSPAHVLRDRLSHLSRLAHAAQAAPTAAS